MNDSPVSAQKEFKSDLSPLIDCHTKLMADVYDINQARACERKGSSAVAKGRLTPESSEIVKNSASDIIDGIYSGDASLLSRGVMRARTEPGALKNVADEVQHAAGSQESENLKIKTNCLGNLEVAMDGDAFKIEIDKNNGDRYVRDAWGSANVNHPGLYQMMREKAALEMDRSTGNGIIRDRWQ